MIAIVDYGMGNLRSVQKAFEKVGAHAIVTHNPADIKKAQRIVLPGVGAMKPAMERLQSLNLIAAITEAVKAGRPFLGICLGLQLLFTESTEGGRTKGLGILPGSVQIFTRLKVPHIGWNQLTITDSRCALFQGIPSGTFVYFCHSYFVKPDDAGIRAATTDYGIDFVSAVHAGTIFGVQFHPEKSQSAGLAILKNFAEVAA